MYDLRYVYMLKFILVFSHSLFFIVNRLCSYFEWRPYGNCEFHPQKQNTSQIPWMLKFQYFCSNFTTSCYIPIYQN